MVEELTNWLMSVMSGLPSELIIFVISMIPILELRGGIAVASALGVPITTAIPICIIGNIIPIPFILLFITKIFELMKKTKLFRPMVEKLESKALGKSDKIKKYEFLGLLLFVGVPLPGTGAWTGSLIAALLRIKNKKAVPAIFCGLLMATAIMCIVSYFIPWVIRTI